MTAERFWEDAVERSKISRISWKKVLGKSMNRYVYDAMENGQRQEDIIHQILIKAKKPESSQYIKGWNFQKVVDNVKIGVSARCSEFQMLGGLHNG